MTIVMIRPIKVRKMKPYRYIIFLLVFVCMHGIQAQNLRQAEKDFDAGNFEKALQTFKVLVKKSPSNPSYNYYYGACCYETGNVVEAIPYLEKSAKRNYINAFRYLGKAYYDQYRFDEAVDCYEQHISLAEDKKRNTEVAEAELSQVHKAALMYKSVEDVAVIDSFVVAKEDFLNAYRLSKETGKLTQQDRTITYETEMGNQQILSQPNEEGTYQLYTRNKLINGWSEPVAVNSLNDLGNVNYPFLMGDGITFYFSSDGDGSLGGYDIFVTRYDSEDNAFLRPNNIGMPFNSFANDYMLVIDELNELGWFASDRNQPSDSVCIYVFVPNNQKVVLDYDSTSPQVLHNAATLKSIQSTWRDADNVRAGKQRLTAMMYQKGNEQKKADFHFIVDDTAIYTTLNDFRSKEARDSFQQLLQKKKDYDALSKELEKQRSAYVQGNTGKRQQLAGSITDLEGRTKQLYEEIDELTERIRNIEISQKH